MSPVLAALVALVASGPIDDGVEGASSIDKEPIRRVIRAHLDQVRACYEAGLARDPSLDGRVVIRFTIDRDGTVGESEVTSTTLTDPAVGECIAEAALGWRFLAGAVIRVSYPFVLQRPGG